MHHHLHHHPSSSHHVAFGVSELVAATRTTTSNAASTISTSVHAVAPQAVPQPSKKAPPLATLTCPAIGARAGAEVASAGTAPATPDCDPQNLVYWRVSPSDDAWRSPWASTRASDAPRYVTFETGRSSRSYTCLFLRPRYSVSSEHTTTTYWPQSLPPPPNDDDEHHYHDDHKIWEGGTTSVWLSRPSSSLLEPR